MRKRLLKIVLHIFGVILFIFATAYALLAAYGYQIDLLHQNIVKTSIVDISSKIKNVEVFFNDELVAKKIPYQIKNIEPGTHELDIYKKNFTKWHKSIEVFEDVVTKIDDVLILPFDYEPYLYTLTLDFDFDDYLINNNFLIFISYNLNELSIYELNNNQLKAIQKINIALANKQLFFIDDYRLGMKDGEFITIIDLSNGNTQKIQIPDEYDKFTVAYNPSLTGYFINGGSIYKATISDDLKFSETTILTEDTTCISSFEVVSSYDHVFLKCDNKLFELKNNDAILIENSISLNPQISKNGSELIYLNNDGEIILYNIYDGNKELLARFIEKINKITWHNNSKFIFIEKDNKLMICDLDFSNCNNFFDKNINLNKSKPEYIYINNNTLAVYDLEDLF